MAGRSAFCLWTVCVACTFLAQLTRPAESFALTAVGVGKQAATRGMGKLPSCPWSAGNALTVRSFLCRIRPSKFWGARAPGGLQMSLEPLGAGGSRAPESATPAHNGQQFEGAGFLESGNLTRAEAKIARLGSPVPRTGPSVGLGPRATETRARSKARRTCKPGQVFRVQPARDNAWYQNRMMIVRGSPFVHALMYSWPTSWLRSERALNSRNEKPPPVAEAAEDSSNDDQDDSALPFEVGRRYRVGSKAGRGAFSVVKTARDLELGRTVAIKRVQDVSVDVTSLRRVMRELALLRRNRG